MNVIISHVRLDLITNSIGAYQFLIQFKDNIWQHHIYIHGGLLRLSLPMRIMKKIAFPLFFNSFWAKPFPKYWPRYGADIQTKLVLGVFQTISKKFWWKIVLGLSEHVRLANQGIGFIVFELFSIRNVLKWSRMHPKHFLFRSSRKIARMLDLIQIWMFK